MTANSNQVKSTFKHALIYSASGMIGKAIGFIMLPVYAHYLRGEGYGIIGMIDVVLAVVTLLIGYGIQGAMSRFYFEKKEELERRQLISTAIILMFLMVLLVSGPVLFFSEPIAMLAFGKEGMGYYIILAILTFMATMTSKSAETYILIRQKPFFYSVLSLVKLLFALSLNIYLIVYLQLGVLGYLYSGLIVAVVFSFVLHWYALSRVGLHFVKNDVVALLRFSLPLLPGYLAMFIRNNTDRVLLRTFLGLTQLGSFEMLFKFATLIGLLVVEPFSKIWGVKRFEIADNDDGPLVMARVYTLMLAVMLAVGLVLSVEIPVLLRILTPAEFWLSGAVVALAVLSRIILASYYHFFFGLLYAKKTHKISLVQIATTFVSVLSCLLLVRPFGILGAVLASCLSAGFQCVAAYKMAQPYYRIPFEWGRIVAVLGFAVIVFVLVESLGLIGARDFYLKIAGLVDGPVRHLMDLLRIDLIRNGKLYAYILNNIPLLVEGVARLVLCSLFLVGLVLSGVLPRRTLVNLVRRRSLRPVLNGG